MMALKENGNPMKASDWEMPVRVVKKDGSPLYDERGITLDMTEWELGGKYYVAWSQRQFHPVDQGAWLYIAQIDPDQPWKLTTDPVLLSMPEYGWANNHTFVDEGPFALMGEDRIFLTFSSAAVDSTYVVGLLSADLDADLLDPPAGRRKTIRSWLPEAKKGSMGRATIPILPMRTGWSGMPIMPAPASTVPEAQGSAGSISGLRAIRYST